MKSFSDIDELISFAEEHEEEVSLTGMIKTAGNDTEILYTPVGCEIWIPISKSAISQSVFLGKQLCNNEVEPPHSHAFVELQISATKAENGDYLRIISAMQSRSTSKAVTTNSSKSALRYFGPVHLLKPIEGSKARSLRDDCGDLRCYYVGDQCPSRCACVGEDGMGFCSTCCIS